MKRIKSALSITICLIIVLSCVACAASESANIYNNETVKYTSSISATKIKMDCHNNASSERNLYFYSEYQGSNGKYYKSVEFLFMPGVGITNYNDTKTTFTTATYWRLEMNPYGILTSGCSGSGTISSR